MLGEGQHQAPGGGDWRIVCTAVTDQLKLPVSVIRPVNTVLDTETHKMGDLIRNLEDYRVLIDQKAQELQKRNYEMRQLKAEMMKQQYKLEVEQLMSHRE